MAGKPVIDGFEIIEPLGEGGMSTVWKARQLSLNRIVVIKVISEDLLTGESNIKQFMLEAQLIASLKHQNIVQVYDFGKCATDQRYYLVMEYISGYSVGDWLRRKGRISESDSLVIAESVAQALRYAWEKNQLVHCDIKPDNIMVDGDGTIKLTDMGLAQAVGKMHEIRGADGAIMVMGTPNYMSPEQVLGVEKLDCRADIYSMGASLYHLMTGVLPFGAFDGAEAMDQQVSSYLEDPRKINPELSHGAAVLIEKMMMKKREQRYADWVEALEDIRLVQLRGVPIGEPPAPGESTVSIARKIEKHPPQKPQKEQAEEQAQGTGGVIIPPGPLSPARAGEGGSEKVSGDGKRALKKAAVAAAPVAPAADVAYQQRLEALQKQIQRQKSRARIAGNIRMLLSLILLAALSYVLYMRHVKKQDVLVPVREQVQKTIKEVVESVREHADTAIEWVQDTWSDLTASKKSEQPSIAPAAESAVEIREEDLHITQETVESVPEAAPAESGTVSSKAISIEETPEFLEILKKCEERTPKLNAPVELKLKYQDAPVKGNLAEIADTGVTIKVPEGFVVYPYAVMKDESRLPFFPKEWARMVYARKYGNTGAAEKNSRAKQ